MNETPVQSGAPLTCGIVVATWQRPDPLKFTLESLLLQSYPYLEILVVCDGPDPATQAIEHGFESSRQMRWIYHAENRGLPTARNTGARESRGDILLFLDDDVVAHPELVSRHMAHHLSASRLRRLAVIALAAEERRTPLNSFIDLGLHEAWQENLDSFRETLSATGIDFLSDPVQECLFFGLNCSIQKDLFLSLGGFNESFKASDEEMEFAARMYAAGIEFAFEPRIMLTHRNATNLHQYFVKSWRASGRLDACRVFEMKQRCVATRNLVAPVKSPWLKRLPARIAWRWNRSLFSFSRQLEATATKANSHLLFSIWARTMQTAEYFKGALESGYTLDQLREAAGRGRVALMLHSVCDPLTLEEKSYYISPKRFSRFMHKFVSRGYKTATLQSWLDDKVPAKHVLLTFDDAYDDLYEHLLPLVIEHHLTPLVFLVADRIGETNLWDQARGLRARNLLTLGQIREMQKYGVLFGSHTLTHPWLPSVSDEQLLRETRDSRLRLEDMLGTEIVSFAYPGGEVDQRVRSAVISAGYKVAFITLPGPNWWNDPFCQLRADISEYTSTTNFLSSLRNGQTLAQTVSATLRGLERDLPTGTLRSIAHRMRVSGRRFYLHVSAEGERREQAAASDQFRI